jgi:hypothetical protein
MIGLFCSLSLSLSLSWCGRRLLAQFGHSSGERSQSIVMGVDAAEDILMFMLIDDGQPDRKRRSLLLNPGTHRQLSLFGSKAKSAVCLCAYSI